MFAFILQSDYLRIYSNAGKFFVFYNIIPDIQVETMSAS